MPTLRNKIFYKIKPLIPREIQIYLRKITVRWKRKSYADIWPIDEKAGSAPENWQGWPERKQFALVIMHDVETEIGQGKCKYIIDIEKEMGFRSVFNFVPKRYNVSQELRQHLQENGFEVGVHGLYHDGNYFNSLKIFQERAGLINHYVKEWGSVGFRSPSMLRNFEWLHLLNIEYDASSFDTDPFEPQPEGTKTIFPFYVQHHSNGRGYIELPYTIPQDSTIFIFMGEKNIDIWKRKLDWIAKNGGMALISVHPDYINFNGTKLGNEEYPVQYYCEFLEYIKSQYKGLYWHVLPKEIARFWSENYKK